MSRRKVEKSNLKSTKIMKRKTFESSIRTKVYVGDKSVNIHFDKKDRDKAISMARAILQAVEFGKDIDIAVPNIKTKSKVRQVTITSPIR